jgi:hypothetical protein
MCHRMRRREFLLESRRAALSFSLLPLVARTQEASAASADGIPEKTLIADLEKQIPRLAVAFTFLAVSGDLRLRDCSAPSLCVFALARQLLFPLIMPDQLHEKSATVDSSRPS